MVTKVTSVDGKLSEGSKVSSVRSLACGQATAPREDEQGVQGGTLYVPAHWLDTVLKNNCGEVLQLRHTDKTQMPTIRIGRTWKSNGFFSRLYVRPDLSYGTAHAAGPRWCTTPAKGGPPGGLSITNRLTEAMRDLATRDPLVAHHAVEKGAPKQPVIR